jgi:Leucine-rich repeat (LRR) protein
MRKCIVILLITAIALSNAAQTMVSLSIAEEHIYISLTNRGITDERLAEMVANGEIPQNVTGMCLGMNQITDISPLAGLTNLRNLSLGYNQISDLTPLANLTNLGRNMGVLSLDNNQISDLTGLENLTNLGVLTLSNNQIVDVTPLQNLTNLWWLELWGNQIEDVMPLAWLTGLDSTSLCLDRNPVANDTEQLAALRAARSRNAHRTTLTLGHVLGTEPYTVNDALEILRYTVGLPSVLDNCTVAVIAALIVNEEVPDVRDALQILRSLVGLSSVFDEG